MATRDLLVILLALLLVFRLIYFELDEYTNVQSIVDWSSRDRENLVANSGVEGSRNEPTDSSPDTRPMPMPMPVEVSSSEPEPRSVRMESSPKRVVNVFYHEIQDSHFGLANSSLSREQVEALIEDIRVTWLDATNGSVSLAFEIKPLSLDKDRALAFLFYVIGHSRIPRNGRRTQIHGNSDWVVAKYKNELDQIEQPMNKLLASTDECKSVQDALATNQGRITREEFASIVGEELGAAFPGLIGEYMSPSTPVITPESFKDFVASKKDSLSRRRVHLAFRLFYLEAGLSVKKTMQLAQVMQGHPMLLLHYAIGRDKDEFTHSLVRSRWEYENTFSIYPTPYYHDLNGRGSTNWMDVLFRTASCWDEQNRDLVIQGKVFGRVQCRWGVRPWEKRRYSIRELGRMIAHELGHCLGISHPQPRCAVYDSVQQANLMQQQRVLALKSWESRCSCLAPSCGNCGCPLDDETYSKTGESRKLEPDQIQVAVHSFLNRDYVESPTCKHCTRRGNKVTDVQIAQPVSQKGVLLKRGDTLVLLNWSGKTRSSIERLRLSTTFRYPKDVRLVLRRFKMEGCSTPIASDEIGFLHFEERLGKAHLEIQFHGLILEPGESLGLELAADSTDKARVRFGEVEESQAQLVCLIRANSDFESLNMPLLINYDESVVT